MDYVLGKIERTNFLDQRGVAVDGYRVYYTIDNGQVDYIEIEKSQYNAANVKAAIEKEIAEHQAVLG